MLEFLLALINPVAKVTQGIIAWQSKKIDAKTEQEKIDADENIKTLQARRDVLVAEANRPINSIARFILMFPFAIIVWQYVVWDKIACKWFYPEQQCSTDNLSPQLWQLAFVVYGFYFLDQIAKRFRK